MGSLRAVYILVALTCYHFSLIPFIFADLKSPPAPLSSESASEEAYSSLSSSSAPSDVSTAASTADIHPAFPPPFLASWRKTPVPSCTLTTDQGDSWGPFEALVTLNNAGDIVAFEPVSMRRLCPLRGKGGPADSLYHVVCPDSEAGGPLEPTWGPSAGVIARPAPDLTYRLSLESINISGLLPRLVATSLRTFVAGKSTKKENPVASLFRWLYSRREGGEKYKITCGDKSRENPVFSYTSFTGELLMAAYEMKDFNRATIPNFAQE